MMTRPAAQLWIVSTMGTDDSTFLHDRVDDGRLRVEADQRSGVCYFEWSATDDADPDDPETWLSCMPALGRTVTVDTIRADHDAMEPGEFARAYLNRRGVSGSPVIPALAWAANGDVSSQAGRAMAFAYDVTPERSYASIGCASRSPSGKLHVELIDRRPGTEWVVPRMVELQSRWSPLAVLYDPASPAGSLRLELAAAGVVPTAVETRTYAQACGAFYDLVMANRLAHLHQPALDAAVNAARKRNTGDAWCWARRSGGDVSPLVSITLALWGLIAAGEGEAQIL
jgi:hypothetical protein